MDSRLQQLFTTAIEPAVIRIKQAIEDGGVGLSGTQNASGEKQLALDVQANQIVLQELEKSGLVASAASEEMEELVVFAGREDAPFTVVFDPLDGSSLVDVNLAVGSIFGVYKAGNPIGKTGDEQLAAAFAVYGPRTTLVMTRQAGTHELRLGSDGKFHMSRENLKIDDEAKHFAPGNLRAAAERDDYLQLTNEWIKKGLTLRYSGGMVPDINHILLKGNGIFAYPAYSKTPDGKLRILFECNPMALLIEQAGGAASDGTGRMLAKKITGLHQRSSIFLGSKKAVEEAMAELH